MAGADASMTSPVPRFSIGALTYATARAPMAAPGTLVVMRVSASGTFVKPCSRYDAAAKAQDSDTTKSELAETACGPMDVNCVSAGMTTTPPPMPQRLPRVPDTTPVGIATAIGTRVSGGGDEDEDEDDEEEEDEGSVFLLLLLLRILRILSGGALHLIAAALITRILS